MPRPTEAKEATKAPGEASKETAAPTGGGGIGLIPMLALAVVIINSSAVSSAAAVYFVTPLVLQAQAPKPAEGEEVAEGEEEATQDEEATETEEHEEGSEHKVGPVIDLGEDFTVNLNDPSGERYLLAKFSMMVSVEDESYTKLSGEALEKWEEGFKHEMGHYMPGVRDVIISTLTKYSAKDLAGEAGKQKVKQEIQAKAADVFHGKHEVLAVNIEKFIIQ